MDGIKNFGLTALIGGADLILYFIPGIVIGIMSFGTM